MKYCRHCGRKLNDFETTCPNCGKGQNDNITYEHISAPYYKEENSNSLRIQKKRNTTVIMTWLVAALVVILLGIIVVLLVNQKGAEKNGELITHKSTVYTKSEEPVITESSRSSSTNKTNQASRIDSYHGNTLPVFRGDGSFVEEFLGENWKQTAAKELNGAIFLKGSGKVGKGSVTIDAALLPDGRIIGRNIHSTGARLDINGLVSNDGSVYIQLGHNNEISFYFLNPAGRSGNTFYLRGTWEGGAAVVNTTMSLTAR